MYPAQFDYRRAGSVDEALGLLQEHEDAKLMAGGHSLIPMMKLRLAQPPVVIDIGRLDELKGISEAGGSVRVGSLTTHAEIAASDVLAAHCPVLAEAAGHIGDAQVRNRGTIGGNIAHADPGSDIPPVLVLVGTDLSDDAIAAAASGLSAEDPIGDIFASGDYRVHVGKVYGKRALAAARDRAS